MRGSALHQLGADQAVRSSPSQTRRKCGWLAGLSSGSLSSPFPSPTAWFSPYPQGMKITTSGAETATSDHWSRREGRPGSPTTSEPPAARSCRPPNAPRCREGPTIRGRRCGDETAQPRARLPRAPGG
jgi:hypothetical protein